MKQLICIIACTLLSVLHTQAQMAYYSSAFGKNGNDLKTELHQIIKNHTTQVWPLWSLFSSTDNKGNNIVWDIYSDNPGGVAPYTFQLGSNQCGSYTQEGDCYNHEHTWPSTYFNDGMPMRTDLHHVLPTDGFVNNKRSNFPYGIVNGAISWTAMNGGKLGKSNNYPGYTLNVFEPIDAYKGDIARIYFYMSTRYQGEDTGWKDWEMANGAQLTQAAITLLLQWHHDDPVSQKEIDRNNAVANIQNNRNPFVDYPMFADCVWGNGDCTSLSTHDIQMEQFISIYPNPSSQYISILYHAQNIECHSIQILDIKGVPVYQSNSSADKIDISHFAPGLYIISFHTNKGIYHRKMSKN